ncbi:MAG: mechanosensitive ion channel family protein, partial [Desulfobacca sp.]|uniref:mechanosensitive ion channel family protein n=1 Tax=Desulfobacca sp. TaxID=2067990 RepID=UPI00404AD48A
YYLLAIIIWLALTLAVIQLLARASAQIVLGGLLVLTGSSLLKHFLRALFAPGRPEEGIVQRPDPTARFYYRYGLAASIFLLVGYYLLWCLRLVGLEGSAYTFAVLSYLLMAILWFGWLLRKPHLEILLLDEAAPTARRWTGVIRSLRLLVLLGLGGIIIIDLLGYQNLALYLAGSAFLSVLVLAGGWLLHQLGNDLLDYLTAPRGLLATSFSWESETLKSIRLFLSNVFHLLLALVMATGIFLSWGVDLRAFRKIVAALSQGPSLGPVTLAPLAIFLAGASVWFARKLSQFSQLVLASGIFRRRQWDLGVQHTIANTVHYTLMTLGVLVALGFLGINFASLAIIAGGLGVGIGFGLQNIVNNFFSGLILLFERPIKIGDLLIIDGQWGTVKAIRVRSTVFEIVDRSVLIIPNSDLLSGKILNWTFYGPRPNRLALKVSVSYGADVHGVTRLLDKVCRQNHRVLPEPPPQIFFSAYGDSSLDFTIWVFVRSPADRVPATHEIHAAIFDTFREKGIEFPYPQLDVHLRTMPAPPPTAGPAPPVIPPAATDEA